MTNPYFNHENNRIDPGSRALDSQINNIADEIALGFDRLPTEEELFGGTTGFANSTGTQNALIVLLPYAVVLTDGYQLQVRFNGTNLSGGATLNVNSTGVKTIVNSDGSVLTTGAMVNGALGTFIYDQSLDRYILISNNSAWGKPSGETDTQLPSEYCPGYTYTFVSTSAWRITGLDQTNLFHIGRRLKFVDGVDTYFGSITSSVFTGGNTDIGMSMEGGDVLTNTITTVCLTTGQAGWSQIATDPFGGTQINDLVVGDISGTTYLFAVGNQGKCGISSDGGLTWIMLSTGTTEHLTCCCYDSDNEQFWGGGDAGVLIDTVNATSITLDTTSIPALASSTDDIIGIIFLTGDGLAVIFQIGSISYGTASSTNQGTSWISRATLGLCNKDAPILHPEGGPTNDFTAGPDFHTWLVQQTGTRLLSGVTDASSNVGDSIAPSICSTQRGFTEAGLKGRMQGAFDGAIDGHAGGWVARDDVTFSQRVRSFAFAPIHERMVMVGDNQQIGYLDKDDAASADAWTNVENGFNPTADILGVVWDDTHGVFIAVADSGQICRSTNGLL